MTMTGEASVDRRYLDIALAASSLAERRAVVRACGAGDPDALAPHRRARLDRLAARLGSRPLRGTATPELPDPAETADLLAAFAVLSDTVNQVPGHHLVGVVSAIHDGWLPTYRAALGRTSDLLSTGDPVEDLAAPFTVELRERLRDARAGLTRPDLIGDGLLDDLGAALLARFRLSLTWTVETAARAHYAQQGIAPQDASDLGHRRFLDELTADPHRFFLAFPVLGRWLAQLTALHAEAGGELIARLAADAGLLGADLFGRRVARFTGADTGLGDYHAGARSVLSVAVELAGGAAQQLIYKPRDLHAAVGLQRLLGALRGPGMPGFAPRTVLAREGYGYEAVIPKGHNDLADDDAVAGVYAELGGYLAVFYILGGGDLHFENILVSDGHAYVCDCETVLGVFPQGQQRSEETLLDSVFKTGLLEWPQSDSASGAMRISGYGGGEDYEMPIPVPQASTGIGGLTHQVRFEERLHVSATGSNRVYLRGELVDPRQHIAAINAGFDAVYGWFAERGPRAADLVEDCLADAEVRFINWGTQVYAQLLTMVQHPKWQRDPLEVDMLLRTLRTHPHSWDSAGELADAELESLWRRDIPLFAAPAPGGVLRHDTRTAMALGLDRTPLDFARERILALTDENRDRQGRYIAASLSAAEIHSPDFAATCLDYARRIGDRLCAQLSEDAAAPWTSFELGSGGVVSADVQGDLYHGSAGIALFLGYLDALCPDPRYRRAAEAGLRHARRATDRGALGAYTGSAGLAYLLGHLGVLWDDPELLAEAVTCVTAAQVCADERLDVLAGVAGAIPVLIDLAPRTGAGLDLAVVCGRRLLERAEPGEADTLSWPTTSREESLADLTGFAHGAAGIGWALVRLGVATGDEKFVAAGLRGFGYEANHFDQAEQDWYDLRTQAGGKLRRGRTFANAWCNGAAGIGLSRVDAWQRLGTESLLTEARTALAATLRNFALLGNDTLCHGRSGNAELLLRFARAHQEPAFQLEANVQVRRQWSGLEDVDAGAIAPDAHFFPGLMLGMSGFGLHFLRLAEPDRVPSVLLLDPPQDQKPR